MPLTDALSVARQIADALEAAHEQGIIHRDLKPQNVKVTPDGTVKVLDFGLAKALTPDSGPGTPDAMNSPTHTNHGTQLGVILGTAAYMAPEQARGKPVDKRADIWAFGVVVYEMLTGRRAFAGDEISDVLAAVLRQDINWSALPADTPTRLRRLLERCLDRDVKTRLRDIGEARVALASADRPDGAAAAALQPYRRAISIVQAAAVTIVAALASALVVSYLRAPAATSPSPVVRLPFEAPNTVASEVGDPTISPDGKTMLFTGRGEDGRKVLWVRALDSGEAKPLPDTDDAIEPFWSWDSKSIAFGAQGKLKRLDLGESRAKVLTDAGRSNNGSWSRNGVIVFSPDYGAPLVKSVLERRRSDAGRPQHSWQRRRFDIPPFFQTANTSSSRATSGCSSDHSMRRIPNTYSTWVPRSTRRLAGCSMFATASSSRIDSIPIDLNSPVTPIPSRLLSPPTPGPGARACQFRRPVFW